jgi:hypothetical protein
LVKADQRLLATVQLTGVDERDARMSMFVETVTLGLKQRGENSATNYGDKLR